MGSISQQNLFSSGPYLSPDQRDLLLAALASNNPVSRDGRNTFTNPNHVTQLNSPPASALAGQTPRGVAFSSDTQPGPPQLHEEAPDVSPFEDLGYDDGLFADLGLNFDFDGKLDGNIRKDTEEQAKEKQNGISSAMENGGDTHDKRKINEDDGPAGDDGGGKRREGDDKTAKKPGRKPLTSEPTTKRKAQNRAAQRAFRERKEKHLKDLEVKVADLEKASESANHENGLLRAQVTRLQAELKDYRKRLSTSSKPITQSPPLGARPSYLSQNVNGSAHDNSFQFDFPKFGNLPGSLTFENGSVGQPVQDKSQAGAELDSPAFYNVPGVLGRQRSSGKPSPSRENPMTAQNGSPTVNNGNVKIDSFMGVISPSSSANASQIASPDYFAVRHGNAHAVQPARKSSEGSVGPRQTSQLAITGYSASTSPSASSMSHLGPSSSACTSPDSYNHNSPMNPKGLDTPLNTIQEELVTPIASQPSGTSAQPSKPLAVDVNGIDWLAQQNGGQFDPVLFGDYREPQDALAAGEYGFFGDVFPLFDFGSALNDMSTPGSAPKSNLMQEVESKQNAEVEASAPGKDDAFEAKCKKLFDSIQKSDAYKNADLDIDSLCADMKKKAVCSEMMKVLDQGQGEGDPLLAQFAK